MDWWSRGENKKTQLLEKYPSLFFFAIYCALFSSNFGRLFWKIFMSRQLSVKSTLFRPSTPDWERRVKDLGHHRVNLKKSTKEGCCLAAKPADIPLWSGNPDNPHAQNIADVTYGDGGADYIPPYFFIEDPKPNWRTGTSICWWQNWGNATGRSIPW